MMTSGVQDDTRCFKPTGRIRRRGRPLGALGALCAAALAAALLAPYLLRPVAAQDALLEDSEAMPSLDSDLVDVRIEGNTTIPAYAIAKYIKTRPGRPPVPEQVREDVRALYATRWFFSVEPRYRYTDAGLVLVFRVLERPIVQKVEYIGNEKLKTKVLAAHTGLQAGSAFDVSVNREAARRLEDLYHEKGYAFATVELERGGDKDDREVIFRINEGKKVKVGSIKFSGNEFFSTALLKTKLRTKAVILWTFGGKYDPATIPDDVSSLRQYYHSLGFFDVKIDHDISFNDDKSRATLEYKIVEGPRYKIRNVEVLGNNIFSEEQLRAHMALTEGQYFNTRLLNKDIDKIQDQYGQLGRLFATVDAIPRFLETPGEADLVYRIDEDKVYRVRRVDVVINGDHPHTRRAVVLNSSLIHPGDLANPKLIKRSEKRIAGTQVFESAPPQNVTVRINKVERDEPPASLADVFRGQNGDSPDRRYIQTALEAYGPGTPLDETEGDHSADHEAPVSTASGRARILETSNIDGTLYTPHDVFDHRAQSAEAASPAAPDNFEPGADAAASEWYRNIGLDKSQIRGQSLDGAGIYERPGMPFFGSNPQGNPLYEPLPDNEVDLIFNATEARTGRLMFGVGVNSDAGVVGSIVLTEQNFDIMRPPRSFRDILNGTAWRGAGQRFRLEAVPGNIVSRYLVNWTDPYFLDTDYSLGVSGFYYQRFLPDWNEERAGGRVTFGRQFTPEISVSGTLRLEQVELSDPDVPTPQLLLDALGTNYLSTGRVTFTHDTRDSAFQPGEGHKIDLSYEQAFGDFTYPRVDVEGRQFFTVYSRPDGGGRHILSVGGQLGWTGDDTPIFERFYAGGFQTFRGFEFRGVGPREMGVRVGGEWMAIGTVEYLIPLMADETIAAVVFTDFGTVENEVAFDDFRATAGAGLRITVPALGPVPLAFDWAVPIVRQDDDETRIFSFYVGFNR